MRKRTKKELKKFLLKLLKTVITTAVSTATATAIMNLMGFNLKKKTCSFREWVLRNLNIKRRKKQMPNLLTFARMLFALALLLFRPLSVWFFVLYLLACLSDLLDGFFARRFHAESSLGARLDSAADFLLCVVLLQLTSKTLDLNRESIFTKERTPNVQ